MTTKVKKVMQKKTGGALRFPAKLVSPVKNFLLTRLSMLKSRKKEIVSDDPFGDTSRLIDNASPDADAAEQFGHAQVSAIKDELNKKQAQIKKAIARIKQGKYGICEDCGKMIDTDRLMVYPEATLCASCQKKREK